jgi:hypothetical protein
MLSDYGNKNYANNKAIINSELTALMSMAQAKLFEANLYVQGLYNFAVKEDGAKYMTHIPPSTFCRMIGDYVDARNGLVSIQECVNRYRKDGGDAALDGRRKAQDSGV